jgi:hypothetical protein
MTLRASGDENIYALRELEPRFSGRPCCSLVAMYVCMYKGWAFTALAPRPTVVYCA